MHSLKKNYNLAKKISSFFRAEELAVVGVEAREFASGSPADRAAALAAVGAPRGSGVLLTTYGMLLHNGDELKRGGSAGGAKGNNKKQQQQGGEEVAAVGNDGPSSSSSSIWDAVVFDEGHCLKNPKTKIAELARSLDSKMKILLSGTPVSFFRFFPFFFLKLGRDGKNLTLFKKKKHPGPKRPRRALRSRRPGPPRRGRQALQGGVLDPHRRRLESLGQRGRKGRGGGSGAGAAREDGAVLPAPREGRGAQGFLFF